MAILPVTFEILETIRKSLGLEVFNRPHGLLADPGDWGTVMTYIPLSATEFKKLGPELQRYVYLVGKGKYGLPGYVPKKFDLPPKVSLFSVSTVYDDFGRLLQVSYKTEEDGPEQFVNDSHRRDKLLETAKKKKIPVKIVIRSRK
ncbi:MAG: hypothetical protein HQM10_24245 [Candidatus Riflebacteria bacterium]|nr:hypothetical protein [Candidatus Riflebacteria bacterium]